MVPSSTTGHKGGLGFAGNTNGMLLADSVVPHHNVHHGTGGGGGGILTQSKFNVGNQQNLVSGTVNLKQSVG